MSLDQARQVSFVYAHDREVARAFYVDTLGLTFRGGDDFGEFYEQPGGGLVRLTPMPDFEATQHPVLGWDVPDIAAAIRALKDKGVAFTVYDGMGQDALGVWTAPDGKAKIAWFADPVGNVLSLSQT